MNSAAAGPSVTTAKEKLLGFLTGFGGILQAS